MENIKLIYDNNRITITPFDKDSLSMIIFAEYLNHNLDLLKYPFEIDIRIDYEKGQIEAIHKNEHFLTFIDDTLETKLILLIGRLLLSEGLVESL